MKPIEMPGTNCTLEGKQPNVADAPAMVRRVSADLTLYELTWQLSWIERIRALLFGRVYHRSLGDGFYPTMLSVYADFRDAIHNTDRNE